MHRLLGSVDLSILLRLDALSYDFDRHHEEQSDAVIQKFCFHFNYWIATPTKFTILSVRNDDRKIS